MDDPTCVRHLQWISGNTDFARNDFLEINKEQMRLRLLAMSTGGIAVSLIFSLFFIQNRNVEVLNLSRILGDQSTVLGALSLSLSIFYALLGLIYVHLSGQRANVVHYLVKRVPSYLLSLGDDIFRYNDHLSFHVAPSRRWPWQGGQAGRRRRKPFSTGSQAGQSTVSALGTLSSVLWSFQSACIFVVPCLLSLIVWPLLLRPAPCSLSYTSLLRELPNTIFSKIYLSGVVLVFLLLLSIWIQWCHFHYAERRRRGVLVVIVMPLFLGLIWILIGYFFCVPAAYTTQEGSSFP